MRLLAYILVGAIILTVALMMSESYWLGIEIAYE